MENKKKERAKRVRFHVKEADFKYPFKDGKLNTSCPAQFNFLTGFVDRNKESTKRLVSSVEIFN